MSPARPPKASVEPSICNAFKHPLRARILEILNEIDISPSQFVRQGLVPDEFYESYQQALSLTSYHFRELEKEGCLEVVRMNPRRGAAEHIYRGLSRVFFSDKEFEEMSNRQREGLSRASIQGVIARTEGAVRSGTFDRRPDRHLTWRGFMSDEQCWKDVTGILAETYLKLDTAVAAAAERFNEESADDFFPATWAMLGYESPPIKFRF